MGNVKGYVGVLESGREGGVSRVVVVLQVEVEGVGQGRDDTFLGRG